MRYLFLALVVFFSDFAIAQARLGHKNNDIFMEFKHKGPAYKRNQKGTLYLVVKNNGFTTYHFFDAQNYSVRAIVFPDNSTECSKLAKEYDTLYCKKGTKEWKVYGESSNAKIEIVTFKSHAFFVWNLTK